MTAPWTHRNPLRIAALISGGGRTLLNIADRIADRTLPATIALVVSSRSDVPGVERARERDLHVRIAGKNDFANPHDREQSVADWIEEARPDLICLCGYVRRFVLRPSFLDKTMNIHPALLPEFGGQGMYGEHVHRAVLAAHRTITGCTVHFVTDEYDQGPIILQRTCPVLPGDDTSSLAARVFIEECIAYPQAIRLFAQQRLKLVNNRVEILPEPD